MRGNPGAPIVAISAVIGLIGASLGSHIYRWELISWQAVAAVMAVLAWRYSRWRP
jgi:hypothetical protein